MLDELEHEGVDYKGIVYNRKEILNTNLFKEFYDLCYDRLAQGFTASLQKDEWPRLSKRDLVPIVIINEEDGIADYHAYNSYPKSYRTERGQFRFMNYDKSIMDIVSRNQVPVNLTKVEFKGLR
jgi:hypothetical protein